MYQDTKTPLLLETIKIEDGIVSNLIYHQKRCNYSRKKLYHTNDILDLQSIIIPPKKGLFRCRILYAKVLISIEYIPYIEKKIDSLRIVSSTLSYDFKYANRDSLNHLLAMHNDTDEIIIEKDGYLTDTTISNIAFFDGNQWVTPTFPLLKGTMRQKLIDKGFLHTKNIKKTDLNNYTQVALINAMIGFKILNQINIIK